MSTFTSVYKISKKKKKKKKKNKSDVLTLFLAITLMMINCHSVLAIRQFQDK